MVNTAIFEYEMEKMGKFFCLGHWPEQLEAIYHRRAQTLTSDLKQNFVFCVGAYDADNSRCTRKELNMTFIENFKNYIYFFEFNATTLFKNLPF